MWFLKERPYLLFEQLILSAAQGECKELCHLSLLQLSNNFLSGIALPNKYYYSGTNTAAENQISYESVSPVLNCPGGCLYSGNMSAVESRLE